MRNRRRLAAAIRVRQELSKRVDRYLPGRSWKSIGEAFSILNADPFNLGLLERFVGSSKRLDSLTKIDMPCPDGDAIREEADAILKGHWSIFGQSFSFHGARPNWRIHPLSGRETPLIHFSEVGSEHLYGADDIKFLWELNRHRYLVRLAQAYFLSQDRRYSDHLVLLLCDWIQEDPMYLGVNWCSALEVGFRSIAWCWIWKLSAQSPSWSTELLSKLLWTLAQAARFLRRYDSVHHSPNTHLTGEALGLLYISSFFDELREAHRWRKFAIDVLEQEALHQFLEDGFHFERSTGYHRYHVEFYLHAYWLGSMRGEDWVDSFREPLIKGLDIIYRMRRDDGLLPVLGDEDGGAMLQLWAGSAQDPAPLLALGSALFDRPEWLAGLPEASTSLTWWLGLSTAKKMEATLPNRLSLPTAGYYLCRDPSEDTPWYCLVDAGPHGGDVTGHAHTDLGHVEIALGKQAIITDPGCAVYGADPERRNWYRSLGAHAMLSIDRNELAQPGGPFAWKSVAPAPEVSTHEFEWGWSCRLWYTIPGNDVRHERQVVMLYGAGIAVIDCVWGKGEHALRWHWPFAYKLEAGSLKAKENILNAGPVDVHWSGNIATTSQLVPAFLSPSYGQEKLVTALEVEGRTSRSVTILATVFGLPDRIPKILVDDQRATLGIVGFGSQFPFCVSLTAENEPIIVSGLEAEW